jgi:hypothetical protein
VTTYQVRKRRDLLTGPAPSCTAFWDTAVVSVVLLKGSVSSAVVATETERMSDGIGEHPDVALGLVTTGSVSPLPAPPNPALIGIPP